MTFKASVKQNERGRSMVEILGVLAVIGVLSFGGIQGYKYAMDKHRANDIVNEVNMRATDIWHLYQDGEKELPDSPDEDAFPEYGEMTQTGFEIGVTSHPPIAFKTWVNDVPSAVCQKVLQENLDDAIKGLKFVQVGDVDAENLTRYTGDIAICGESGTMNQMVFTSFLSEGGGAVGGIVDPNNPNGPALEPCVDEEDCPQECGGAVCDPETMTCRDACVGTDKPFCMRASGICVECKINEDCQHKGRGWICDESNNTCTELKKTCPEGTFRSQNGACISCDDGSNFFVLKDGQGFPDTSDEADGYTMCGECEGSGTKRWRGELQEDSSRGYCSFMCTEGYSYQSSSEGCISCSDMTRHNIQNESISKAQCLACSENHAWYGSYLGGYWCQQKLNCADDEFIKEGTPYRCVKCSDNRNQRVQIWWVNSSSTHSNFRAYTEEKCNSCPDSAPRYVMERYCYPVCEQPENADEQIEICKANPKDENCTRQWQNTDGACFSCDKVTTSNKINAPAQKEKLIALCTACGRKVEGDYCVLEQSKDDCEKGQFLGKDNVCRSCDKTTSSVTIVSEDVSGCESRCKKNENGEYDENGTILTMEVFNSKQSGLVCRPVCASEYINDAGGTCVACGTQLSSSTIKLDLNAKSDCDEKCPYRTSNWARTEWGTQRYCVMAECPNTQTTKYFKTRTGTCVSCNRANNGDDDAVENDEAKRLCNECGNRIMIKLHSYFCRLINPGVSGICNNIGNDYYSDANLTATIKDAAEAYIKGDYNGVYYRSNDGYCRRCDSDVSYTTTQEQCASCKNRRYEGGNCLKGLCSEGQQFLNTSATCVSCSQKNVPVNPDITNLCSSCENRRVMTTGFEEQDNLVGKCVEDCPSGMWQDKDGKCYFCEEASTKEIGTDEVSKNMCQTVCGRTIEVIENADSEITGYKCALSS